MNQPLISEQLLPTRRLPDFFPERIRKACAGKRIRYHIPAGVRSRMEVPENIDAVEWADKYHRVTAIDAHPGRWRFDLVPHTVKPLRFASASHVRQLWLCWPERAAKTNVMLIAAKRTIDRGIDSGNIFWLMPNEHEAKKAIGERVIESLKASPRTARLLSRYADDTTRTIIRFNHGPRLFAAWAGSAASVSSFFGKLCIGDEIDKADTTGVGKETDILTLLLKRGRDRDDSKFLFGSTPAQGFIYKGTMGCAQVWEYHPRCPHCGELVRLTSKNIVIPSGASAEDCAHGTVQIHIAHDGCGIEWDEQHRSIAYHSGEWVCVKGTDLDRPATVGMHMTAYVLPNIPLTEISEKIVKAREGGETEKKALANGYDVEDYKVEQVTRKEDHIFRLIDPTMPRGVVPRGINSLLIIADTQKVGFYYEVVAFGWGRDLTCWVIDHGYVEQFDHLNKIADRDYFDADGRKHLCRAGFIDSGGGTDPNHPKHSRTREVYDFCIDNPFWCPGKGRQRQTSLVSWTRLDFYPGRDGQKVAIPGGLLLYTLDTTQYKNIVERKLNIDLENPGGVHLHSGLTVAELESWQGPLSVHEEGINRWRDYAKQMCSEFKDERGMWQCLPNHANHHFDIATYRYAFADILMIGDDKPDEPEEQQENRPAKPETNKRRRW